MPSPSGERPRGGGRPSDSRTLGRLTCTGRWKEQLYCDVSGAAWGCALYMLIKVPSKDTAVVSGGVEQTRS